MNSTKIEWAAKTWNPITGCSKISAACDHCYAERMSYRLRGRFGYPVGDPFRVTFHENRLGEPLKIKKPSVIFVCSMGDIFHDNVDTKWINLIFEIIKMCPQHIFLLLTKRPQNISMKIWGISGINRAEILKVGNYLSNIWIGVTVENQEQADSRIPKLMWHTDPFFKRFVSCEPLLGSIDLLYCLNAIAWIIVGGETGVGSRKMKPRWIDNLYQQSRIINTPFFFKQWGTAYKNVYQYCNSDYPKEYPEWR